MLAFVLEIGNRLQEVVFACVLVVTVGGYLGAWRDKPPKRSLGAMVFGDDDGDSTTIPSKPFLLTPGVMDVLSSVSQTAPSRR